MRRESGSDVATLELDQLAGHVRSLATLDPDPDAPVVSCYLDLARGDRARWKAVLDARRTQLRRGLAPRAQEAVDGVFRRIVEHVRLKVHRPTRSVAIFARGGCDPFLLSIPFAQPMETFVTVGPLPDIYQLVEMKDAYDRYLVLMVSGRSARIFEVHLGAATRELWFDRPDTRERVGDEWTRLRYQDHRLDPAWTREIADRLSELLDGEGCPYVVLAGDPRRVAELRRALPASTGSQIIDSVRLAERASADDVVAATLDAFVRREEADSAAMVDQLFVGLHRHGVGATGAARCLTALQLGCADVLIMHRTADLGKLVWCEECQVGCSVDDEEPGTCPFCEMPTAPPRDAREELVRLALASGVPIETVRESQRLVDSGGVGTLLRWSMRL